MKNTIRYQVSHKGTSAFYKFVDLGLSPVTIIELREKMMKIAQEYNNDSFVQEKVSYNSARYAENEKKREDLCCRFIEEFLTLQKIYSYSGKDLLFALMLCHWEAREIAKINL